MEAAQAAAFAEQKTRQKLKNPGTPKADQAWKESPKTIRRTGGSDQLFEIARIQHSGDPAKRFRQNMPDPEICEGSGVAVQTFAQLLTGLKERNVLFRNADSIAGTRIATDSGFSVFN